MIDIITNPPQIIAHDKCASFEERIRELEEENKKLREGIVLKRYNEEKEEALEKLAIAIAENKKLREALEYLNTITVLPEKVKPIIKKALKEGENK